MKIQTHWKGIFFVLCCMVLSSTANYAAIMPKIDTPSEKRYLTTMKNREIQIKDKLALTKSQTCGELFRAIKEYEEGIAMLGSMITTLKAQIKELQRQIQTDLVQEKLALRLYLFKEWKRLLGQFKLELTSLQQQATNKGCHQNLITPCTTRPDGQLQCR